MLLETVYESNSTFLSQFRIELVGTVTEDTEVKVIPQSNAGNSLLVGISEYIIAEDLTCPRTFGAQLIPPRSMERLLINLTTRRYRRSTTARS